MEQEEFEDNGLTIGEIFKIIFGRVWWVLGSIAACVIIAVLLLQLWYNPSDRTYTVSYDVRYANQNGYYPDGTKLTVSDSILLENLQIIKNQSLLSSEKKRSDFDGIDVEAMIEEDDITLTTSYTELDNGTYETHYSLSIKSKYFSNEEQAAAFMKAVAEYPVVKVMDIVKNTNYLVKLQDYDDAQNYSEKISHLFEQAEYISAIYENIKSVMGGDYMPLGSSDGKSIDDYIRELNTLIDTFNRSGLEDTVSANYYVLTPSVYVADAEATIRAKLKLINDNENIITALKAQRDEILKDSDLKSIEAYDSKIAEYTEENSKLRNEITESVTTLCRMETYLAADDPVRTEINTIRTNLENSGVEMAPQGTANDSAIAAKKAFDDKLEEYREKLEVLTLGSDGNGGAKQMRVNMYESQSMVIYVNNKIKTEGGMNVLLGAIIGALVGFIVSGIVVYIIDSPKYKREKLAAQNGVKEVSGSSQTEEK